MENQDNPSVICKNCGDNLRLANLVRNQCLLAGKFFRQIIHKELLDAIETTEDNETELQKQNEFSPPVGSQIAASAMDEQDELMETM